MRIDVYGDLLCLVERVTRGDDIWYDIWLVREYGVEESWIRLHAIQLFSSHDVPRQFLGFGINRESLLGNYQGLTVFDPDKEELKSIEFNRYVGFSSVVTCVESLVFLKGGNE